MLIFRLLGGIVRWLIVVVVVVLAIPVLGLAYGFVTTEPLDGTSLRGIEEGAPPQTLADQVRAEISGYQRPEESTYLTYPEWTIVYAAREYAGFVKENRESYFPYWAYIGRFWQDYATMIRASSDAPFNFQNHQMLAVIGTSHTIEHAIQWAYEKTIGTITQWTSRERIGVDAYQANIATEYASFLDQVPWYQFPYAEKRAGLMAVVRAPGEDEVRTRERKLAFGIAYSIKQGYADLIKSALAATSDPAFLDIHVWAKGPVAEAIAGEPGTRLEKDFGADGVVFVTKRYQVFTEMIPRLIARGVSFVEIGGNDEVFVTVLSNDAVEAPAGTRLLFGYQLPADPTVRRSGLIAAVPQLHTVLPILNAQARLEHIYDY
jgi:hypothetical protein